MSAVLVALVFSWNAVSRAAESVLPSTLVFIVGIFDLLRTIEVARIDPKWAAPNTSSTGYAVAAIFYFVFCYGMSRYARATEERLAKGEKR